VGILGGVPEVKKEGEVFLEENETTQNPRPLKFLIADGAPFNPWFIFPFQF
jgi:uncharacterized protein YegL